MCPAQAEVESAISAACNSSLTIVNTRRCAGGSINDCQIVTMDDGRDFFVKSNTAARKLKDMFALEFKALLLLSQPAAIRVPRPLLSTDNFIVMEAYSAGPKPVNWPEEIGRQLALLHRATIKDRYGFEADNFLGTSLQKNAWSESWLNFWRENRLSAQLDSFAEKTSGEDRLLQQGRKLVERLDSILGDVQPPAVLLHGDLWSGNAAATDRAEVIIFDPASYYGHNETEFGMMRMFGGFGPRCEAAYAEIWPFEDESERRIDLYRLYHELNHLNLFGSGYYESCLSTIKALL